ncbi:MAG: type I DNA topoisomerase [Robiginitomaculum sp.]|nr:type I DNA topoisomerase [Robiginitomaculum sp.]
MKIVVVESPAKAKTINKYLGEDYFVLASFGHVRDLPAKNGSVRPDEDFAMSWEVGSRSAKHLKAIADATKGATELILATDPDREGEAISWHLIEALKKRRALKKDVPVSRVVFNAITRSAVTTAMQNPRQLDMELVEAYLARRALDYLVGFTLSPVLWRKLPGSRSAGRVQSVALRLICSRELEIEKFKSDEYWSVAAKAKVGSHQLFDTRLVELGGKKLTKLALPDEASAKAARQAVEASDFTISSVEAKPTKRHPSPPFITSTLQQEASRKLGFAASQTMRAAQRLYEGINIGGETVGLITYMRTDSVQMAPEGVSEARDIIAKRFGSEYVPEKPRYYKSKAKNAQEAHEAIRPTSFFRHPDSLRLDGDEKKLYWLIWNRAVSSQMQSARQERTTIELNNGSATLRAVGTVTLFDGFLVLYQEGKDDRENETDSQLPKVSVGEAAAISNIETDQHFTQPPPRFTEASLVKEMENLGIGRPSTYASILQVLQDRDYVTLDKKRFIPDDKGRVVVAFLENFFARYVQYDFTAELEQQLDAVAEGKLNWKKLLSDFWKDFSAAIDDIADLRVTHVLDALDEALEPHLFPHEAGAPDPRKCPSCDDGRLGLKLSRYGAFIGCSKYPDCKFTKPLTPNGDGDATAVKDETLGTDPKSGLEVYLKTGRFGPYVQLGDEDKPKRGSIPKSWSPDQVDLEQALKLLSLPRDVGVHPEDGKMITAAIGRYGPYVHHEKTYANLPAIEDVFEIGLNRAVDMIADKRAKKGGRAGAKVLKELGDHPTSGKTMQVLDGRYGAYIKHEKTNATLPRGTDPVSVTVEQAVEWVDAKAAKGKKKKPAKKKAAPKKKPATKKKATTKKKPAAKKKS